MALNVSFFTSITSTTPDLRIGVTWAELVGLLGPHRPWASKDGGPLYSPAEWQMGHGPRRGEGDRNIVVVHFGCFDLDKCTEEDIVEIASGLPCRHLLLSTWSHSRAQGKYRLLLEYSRPVLKSEAKLVWDRVNERLLRGKADRACRDTGHRYYCPSHPEAPDAPPVHVEGDGPPLSIDTLLGEQVARVVLPEDDGGAGGEDQGLPTATGAGLQISRDQLRRIADSLARSRNKADLGRALRQVIKGDPFADKGARHNTTFRLVCEILDRYPLADAGSIAEHFATSLALMQPTHVTTDVILEMVRGKQAAPRSGHTKQLIEAFAPTFGTGAMSRTTPYTEDELVAFCEQLEVPRDRLNRRWVVQHGQSYYLFCNGRYEHYTSFDVREAAARDLAPAITANVDLMHVTQRGARPKTGPELVQDYGVVATSVKIDYCAQFSRYDDTTRTMVEAPCPLRGTPEYDPEIAHWLSLLAGPSIDRLNQWLAAVPLLDLPCAALYLEGKKGTGKSMLALGVAKLFTDNDPPRLEDALGHFNDDLLKCPVVFGDETAPVDSRGKLRTPEIREFIQARSRPLRRKYKANATLTGCIRLILAANNVNLLETSESLTQHDIEAIVERFFYLPVQEEAAAYLADLKQKDPEKTNLWVAGGGIARHCLWLSQNVVVPRTSRFLVSGEASELTRSLQTGTGLRAAVCQWLVSYLTQPSRFSATASRSLIRVRAGRLYVNVMALADNWTLYIQTKSDPPSPTLIARALAGLSTAVTLRDITEPSKNVKFRLMDLSLLAEWAERVGSSDEAGLKAALHALDEEKTWRTN